MEQLCPSGKILKKEYLRHKIQNFIEFPRRRGEKREASGLLGVIYVPGIMQVPSSEIMVASEGVIFILDAPSCTPNEHLAPNSDE